MNLTKIHFYEEIPQNFNKQSFVLNNDVSTIVKEIIENNKLLSQILSISYLTL